MRALIDHGLNREDMSLLHETYGFVRSIVWHSWRLMEYTSDAMACVRAHDRVTVRLHRVRDNVSDLSVHLVWSTIVNRCH